LVCIHLAQSKWSLSGRLTEPPPRIDQGRAINEDQDFRTELDATVPDAPPHVPWPLTAKTALVGHDCLPL
jgi:hypothetical protein